MRTSLFRTLREQSHCHGASVPTAQPDSAYRRVPLGLRTQQRHRRASVSDLLPWEGELQMMHFTRPPLDSNPPPPHLQPAGGGWNGADTLFCMEGKAARENHDSHGGISLHAWPTRTATGLAVAHSHEQSLRGKVRTQLRQLGKADFTPH